MMRTGNQSSTDVRNRRIATMNNVDSLMKLCATGCGETVTCPVLSVHALCVPPTLAGDAAT
jgi:hypothetical protein